MYAKPVKLEWDNKKRDRTERGLDFADVASVEWELAFTREDDRADYSEVRFVTIAPIGGRLCVFVWCERGDALRVISLRKANDREKSKYEKALHRP